MTARVLLHPRVVKDPAAMQLLTTTLGDWGYDTSKLAVYDPPSVRQSNVHELVRDKGTVVGIDGDVQLYERMDGSQLTRPIPTPYDPRRA